MPAHSHRFALPYIRSRRTLPLRACEPVLRPRLYTPRLCNSAGHRCGDNEQAARDNRESLSLSSNATLRPGNPPRKYFGTRNSTSHAQPAAQSTHWESKSTCDTAVPLRVELIHKHHGQVLKGFRGINSQPSCSPRGFNFENLIENVMHFATHLPCTCP